MSLLDFIGVGNTVEQTQKAAQEVVLGLAPILQDAENRLGGIGESLLDRIDGATITIPEIVITVKLKPIPVAQPVT